MGTMNNGWGSMGRAGFAHRRFGLNIKQKTYFQDTKKTAIGKGGRRCDPFAKAIYSRRILR
jgi:hypothetical protein